MPSTSTTQVNKMVAYITANMLMSIVWFFIFLYAVKAIYIFFTRFEKQITIDENMSYGGRKGYMRNLVSDKENNIYAVHNEPLLLHWRSAEVLAELNPGKTYRVKGYGKRIPFLAFYPVITHVEKI